ncbi:MAG: hypothetical protein H6841_07580 [Planctomycetes bacterium]|nr:hypothetical protein [Planctomycetota bacterium]MCB9935218.1 hypothetical protein [Planctomycetota bacterium]
MKRVLTVLAVVLLVAFAVDLSAQGRNWRRNSGSYKRASEKAQKAGEQQAKKAQKNAEKEEREDAREDAKEEREAKRNGEEEDGIAIAGGDQADDLPEPGETVARAIKDETLEEVMDELGLEDKNKRTKFKTNVRGAWEDTEKEDKRYSVLYKKYLENSDKLAAEKKVHQEKLKKIWDESDEKLKKEEVLDEKQTEAWKKTSEELRTKTATDVHYEGKAKQAEPEKKEDKKEKKEDSED